MGCLPYTAHIVSIAIFAVLPTHTISIKITPNLLAFASTVCNSTFTVFEVNCHLARYPGVQSVIMRTTTQGTSTSTSRQQWCSASTASSSNVRNRIHSQWDETKLHRFCQHILHVKNFKSLQNVHCLQVLQLLLILSGLPLKRLFPCLLVSFSRKPLWYCWTSSNQSFYSEWIIAMISSKVGETIKVLEVWFGI